jgi:hypothetical protein
VVATGRLDVGDGSGRCARRVPAAAAPHGATIERGDVLGAKGSTIGRSVLVRDDTAIGHCALAWRNQSTTLVLTGPCGSVSAIFDEYPI